LLKQCFLLIYLRSFGNIFSECVESKPKEVVYMQNLPINTSFFAAFKDSASLNPWCRPTPKYADLSYGSVQDLLRAKGVKNRFVRTMAQVCAFAIDHFTAPVVLLYNLTIAPIRNYTIRKKELKASKSWNITSYRAVGTLALLAAGGLALAYYGHKMAGQASVGSESRLTSVISWLHKNVFPYLGPHS
jgi:hypothetical protein